MTSHLSTIDWLLYALAAPQLSSLNRELFNEKLKKENKEALYERNRKIIDFDYIPEHLVDGFKKQVLRL